jgi:uncharacterized protein YcfL
MNYKRVIKYVILFLIVLSFYGCQSDTKKSLSDKTVKTVIKKEKVKEKVKEEKVKVVEEKLPKAKLAKEQPKLIPLTEKQKEEIKKAAEIKKTRPNKGTE